jgi:hypothetical protein
LESIVVTMAAMLLSLKDISGNLSNRLIHTPVCAKRQVLGKMLPSPVLHENIILTIL